MEFVFKSKSTISQTQIQTDTLVHLWPQHLGHKQADQEPKVIQVHDQPGLYETTTKQQPPKIKKLKRTRSSWVG